MICRLVDFLDELRDVILERMAFGGVDHSGLVASYARDDCGNEDEDEGCEESKKGKNRVDIHQDSRH